MRWRWEGRDLPSLDEWSPLLPRFLTPCGEWRRAPGGSRGRVVWVYNGEMTPMSGEREEEDGLRRSLQKNKINNKWGSLQHPLYIVLVFPCWSLKQCRCPEHCWALCRRATVGSALLLPASYTDMMCLTKAGGGTDTCVLVS